MNTQRESHTIGHTAAGAPIKEVGETIHIRKLDRMVARKVLKKHGISRACHHEVQGQNKWQLRRTDSYFSTHWKGIMGYGTT